MKPLVLVMLVAFSLVAVNCAGNSTKPPLYRNSYREQVHKKGRSERLGNFAKIQNRVNNLDIQQRARELERQELVKRNLAYAKLLAKLRLQGS